MGYEHGIYIKGLYPTSMNTYEGRFNDGKFFFTCIIQPLKRCIYKSKTVVFIAIATFGAMGDSAFEVDIFYSFLCFPSFTDTVLISISSKNIC